MDYSFDKDFETIVLIALLVGALGGFAWEVANPIRRLSKKPAVGLDNRITFPFVFRERGKPRGFDFGFLGPLVIGALAGAVTVFLAGRSGPDGADVVRELSNIAAQPADSKTADAAEQVLASGIDKPVLYALAFIGGIAGWSLLQALASRLSSLFEVIVQQSARATSEAAAKAVEDEAAKQDVADGKVSALAEAARSAVVATAAAVAPPRDG